MRLDKFDAVQATTSTAAPKCPQCGVSMLRRKSTRGEFWGCREYPRCKGTRPMNGSGEKRDTVVERVWEPIPIVNGTDEQEVIWLAFNASTPHMVIKAYAGTGKTFTMVQGCLRNELVGGAPRKSIVYLAFNKHNAEEHSGKLRASGVTLTEGMTCHSYGYRGVRKAFPNAVVRQEKVRDIVKALRFTQKMWWTSEWELARMLKPVVSAIKNNLVDIDALTYFDEITSLCDYYGIDTPVNHEQWAQVADAARMTVAEGDDVRTYGVDYDDMPYLPVRMKLELPRVDVVIVDEAQDLNRTQQELVMRAAGAGRVVVVGDPHQCQPPKTEVLTTSGEWVRIQDLKAGDEVASFDRHSSAFVGRVRKGKRVNNVVRRIHTGKLLQVRCGNHAASSTPEHKWVAKFTSRRQNLWCVYLMRKGGVFRVGWCQMFNRDGNYHPGHRVRLEGAQSLWMLKVFDDKAGATMYESLVAADYGIPLTPFHPVNDATYFTQSALDKFWGDVHQFIPCIKDRARRCLTAHGLSYNHPFYTVNDTGRQGRSTVFVTQACNLVAGVMSLPVYKGEKQVHWTPITSIKSHVYIGDVVSLDVEGGTYVCRAPGYEALATHNSIYGFRGADTNSMDNMYARLVATERGCVELGLTMTRRCNTSALELARRCGPVDIKAMDEAPVGVVRVTKELDARPGDMVMSRTNAPLMEAAYSLLRRGVKAVVKGKDLGDSLARLVEDAGREGETTAQGVMEYLGRWRATEMMKLQKLSAAGRDVETRIAGVQDKYDCLVTLVANAPRGEFDEEPTPDGIAASIKELFAEMNPDGTPKLAVVLGTVHRTKGLESERVWIIRPELYGVFGKKDWERQQERNIAYVAVTRVKWTKENDGEINVVDAGNGVCPWFIPPTSSCDTVVKVTKVRGMGRKTTVKKRRKS